jgi:hypothetical protein
MVGNKMIQRSVVRSSLVASKKSNVNKALLQIPSCSLVDLAHIHHHNIIIQPGNPSKSESWQGVAIRRGVWGGLKVEHIRVFEEFTVPYCRKNSFRYKTFI